MALGFYRLDVDKDGLLRQDGFVSLGQQVAEQLRSADGSAHVDRSVQAFVNLWDVFGKPADTDKDNAVSFDEFARAHEEFLKNPHAREQGVGLDAMLFAALDANGDGQLTAREYAAFLQPMGVSTADAETAFQHLDRDGDGLISDDELAVDLWEYWNSEDRAAPGNWLFGAY